MLLGSFPLPYWSLWFVDSTAVKNAFSEADVSFLIDSFFAIEYLTDARSVFPGCLH